MREIYSCRGWCGMGTAQPDMATRRALRCALPGISEERWGDGSEAPREYMGRLPIYGQVEPDDDVRIEFGETPQAPRDSHADGCPGAWIRCGFAQSIEKYERLLLEHGFQSNLLADRTHDRLVIEALQFIESERVRARAHHDEQRRIFAEQQIKQ